MPDVTVSIDSGTDRNFLTHFNVAVGPVAVRVEDRDLEVVLSFVLAASVVLIEQTPAARSDHAVLKRTLAVQLKVDRSLRSGVSIRADALPAPGVGDAFKPELCDGIPVSPRGVIGRGVRRPVPQGVKFGLRSAA